jgi:hypothetical protein
MTPFIAALYDEDGNHVTDVTLHRDDMLEVRISLPAATTVPFIDSTPAPRLSFPCVTYRRTHRKDSTGRHVYRSGPRRERWWSEFVVSIEMLRDGWAAAEAFNVRSIAPRECIKPELESVYLLHKDSRFMQDRRDEAEHDMNSFMVRFRVYGSAIQQA